MLVAGGGADTSISSSRCCSIVVLDVTSLPAAIWCSRTFSLFGTFFSIRQFVHLLLLLLFVFSVYVSTWSEDGEKDREENQSVEQSDRYNQKEYLELFRQWIKTKLIKKFRKYPKMIFMSASRSPILHYQFLWQLTVFTWFNNLITLKNVWKAYDFEIISKQKARKVLIPPFSTAGPISVRAASARSGYNNAIKNFMMVCYVDIVLTESTSTIVTLKTFWI